MMQRSRTMVRAGWVGGLALAAASLFCADAHAVILSDLYNTGVDNSNAVLAVGSPEQHYSVSGAAASAFVIATHPAWVIPPAGSAWIGPSGGDSGGPVGLYNYLLTFDLTGLNPSTAQISGNWTSDNDSAIFLNGVATGDVSAFAGFGALSPFSVNSGFVSGVNSLEFRVNNGGGPTGLLVSGLAGSADALTELPNGGVIPEPGSMILMGLGLLGLGIRRKF